jgi:RNA polymerase sigma factor (sigma-70 family)
MRLPGGPAALPPDTRSPAALGVADCLAQDTFLFDQLPKMEQKQPRALLVNQRHAIAAESVEEALMMPDQAAGPETALIEKERMALLQRAMRCLPEAARSVLVLREYGGLSYQEIASVLDVPVGTVMSRLNYARNRLREILRGCLVKTESEYAK